MGNIVQPLMYVTKAISATTNFFDMIDSERVKSDGLREPEVTANGDIELKDVTFAYPSRPGVQVLSKFNATFRNGKTTALVGPSGSGKSTIVALVERWYQVHNELGSVTARGEGLSPQVDNHIDNEDPATEMKAEISHGSITINGHDINDLDLKWWRTQIGLVQQEPFLFNDTIEKNVAFGLIGTKWENAEPAKKFELVQQACVEAFADEFIRNLPKVSEACVISENFIADKATSGLQFGRGRSWHQTQWWSASTHRHC